MDLIFLFMTKSILVNISFGILLTDILSQFVCQQISVTFSVSPQTLLGCVFRISYMFLYLFGKDHGFGSLKKVTDLL